MGNELLPDANPDNPDVQHKTVTQLLHIAEFSRSLGMINVAAHELETRARKDPDNSEVREAYQYALWQQTYFEAIQHGETPKAATKTADFRVWDYELYHPNNPQHVIEELAREALFLTEKE